MNVQEAIEILSSLPKNLEIRLINSNESEKNEENVWLHTIEYSKTGESGYELEGEVRLIGNY